MRDVRLKTALVLVLVMLVSIVVAGCGDSEEDALSESSRSEVEQIVRAELAKASAVEPGLPRAEVEQIVKAAVAETAAAMPEPSLTPEEVEAMVEAALTSLREQEPTLARGYVEDVVLAVIAGMADPGPGLDRTEVEQIARNAVATIPPKSAPARYTKFFVDNAVSRYQAEGLDATVSHYNQIERVDGQWYVFIIDDEGKVISHCDSHLIGEDLKGPVGTDANGYNFGPQMLSATGEGRWVSYVHQNPEGGGSGPDHTGAVEYKHVWVVRHDGMLFASGWYVPADEYTKFFVQEAIARYHARGLEGTLNQSQGGMCIYNTSVIGLGFSQKSFGL